MTRFSDSIYHREPLGNNLNFSRLVLSGMSSEPGIGGFSRTGVVGCFRQRKTRLLLDTVCLQLLCLEALALRIVSSSMPNILYKLSYFIVIIEYSEKVLS